MSSEKTLLDKALESKRGRKTHSYSKEERDLSIAWLNGQVAHGQVRDAIESNGNGGVYAFLALALRDAREKGEI